MLLQKVDPDGLFVSLREDTPAVALYQTGLAHRAVAHDDHLDGQLHVAQPVQPVVAAQVGDVHIGDNVVRKTRFLTKRLALIPSSHGAPRRAASLRRLELGGGGEAFSFADGVTDGALLAPIFFEGRKTGGRAGGRFS